MCGEKIVKRGLMLRSAGKGEYDAIREKSSGLDLVPLGESCDVWIVTEWEGNRNAEWQSKKRVPAEHRPTPSMGANFTVRPLGLNSVPVGIHQNLQCCTFTRAV